MSIYVDFSKKRVGTVPHVQGSRDSLFKVVDAIINEIEQRGDHEIIVTGLSMLDMLVRQFNASANRILEARKEREAELKDRPMPSSEEILSESSEL